jgi:hypothetical protein
LPISLRIKGFGFLLVDIKAIVTPKNPFGIIIFAWLFEHCSTFSVFCDDTLRNSVFNSLSCAECQRPSIFFSGFYLALGRQLGVSSVAAQTVKFAQGPHFMRLPRGVKRGPIDLGLAGIQSDAAHGTRTPVVHVAERRRHSPGQDGVWDYQDREENVDY